MLPDSCWLLLSGTGWGQNQFQKQMRFKWVTEIQKLWGSCALLQSVGACTEKITLDMPVIRMCFREVINHAYSYSMDLSTLYEVWKTFTEWVKRKMLFSWTQSIFFFHIQWQFYNFNKTSVCRHQRISKTVNLQRPLFGFHASTDVEKPSKTFLQFLVQP